MGENGHACRNMRGWRERGREEKERENIHRGDGERKRQTDRQTERTSATVAVVINTTETDRETERTSATVAVVINTTETDRQTGRDRQTEQAQPSLWSLTRPLDVDCHNLPAPAVIPAPSFPPQSRHHARRKRPASIKHIHFVPR